MIERALLFLLLGVLMSCNGQTKWKGGAIKKEGTYENDEVRIVVSDDDYSLKYTMFDKNGDTLFVNPDNISTVHRWALHLDKRGNLWVFSSDRGDFCWRRTGPGLKFTKIDFVGLLPKDSIPVDVYNTLKEFYPYNQQK